MGLLLDLTVPRRPLGHRTRAHAQPRRHLFCPVWYAVFRRRHPALHSVVRYSSFVVRRSPFGLARSTFVVPPSPFTVRPSTFDVRRSSFVVRRSASCARGSRCFVRRSSKNAARRTQNANRQRGSLHLHCLRTRRGSRHRGFLTSIHDAGRGLRGHHFDRVFQIRHERVIADAEDACTLRACCPDIARPRGGRTAGPTPASCRRRSSDGMMTVA